MKLLIILSVFATSALARQVDFDLSKLKKADVSPAKFARGGRIIGGQSAAPGQFPHHVFLSIDASSVCGGSLIKPYFVLTAAHCLYGKSSANAYTTVDLDQQTYWSSGSAQLLVHPQFDPSSLINDIGLIQLMFPATVTYYTNFIALPPASFVGVSWAGYYLTVTGFGRFSDASQDISRQLKSVDLPGISNDECAQTYGSDSLTNKMCTASPGGTSSTCQGDSGGGLFYSNPNYNNYQKILVGIVSSGPDNCEQGLPVLFTDVANFLDWINSNSF